MASAVGRAPEVVDDVRRVEVAVVGQVWMSRTAESPFSSSMCAEPRARGRPRPTRGSSRSSTSRRSPTSATSTVTFLLISDGSMSMWIFLRVRRVGLEVAGDAIVEAHAERDQQVGFLDRDVDPRLAVHAHHAEVERVRGREAADAEQRHRDRDLRALGEGAQLALAPEMHDAVAGEDHRPLRRVDQRDRLRRAPSPAHGGARGRAGVPARRRPSRTRTTPAARPW